jgi:nucleoid-associated protein
MQIKEAIVHRIDKDRHHNGKLTLAPACLPIDPILTDAVEKARKTYGTTASRAFGTFEANVRLFPFSGLLADYLNGKLDMLNFSGQAMTMLVREMDKQALATGGYPWLFLSPKRLVIAPISIQELDDPHEAGLVSKPVQ